jgi:phenylalanine-4-hydroxylase
MEAVELERDHPGFSDMRYRARRGRIAEISEGYVPGGPIPDVDYTPVEDAVWATVCRELAPLHQERACSAYLEGAAALGLPRERVPQLRELSGRLRGLTGFTFRPVPGLVPARTFYELLGERVFCSTQYLRHESVPLYTPEPDLVHEVIGHGNGLASPVIAELSRQAGLAAKRTRSEEALAVLSRVFWFSLEFGVVREAGRWKAYGAGLLSSYGELQAFDRAEIRPLDVEAMGSLEYDITRYQPVLFGGESMEEVAEVVGGFFAAYGEG